MVRARAEAPLTGYAQDPCQRMGAIPFVDVSATWHCEAVTSYLSETCKFFPLAQGAGLV